MKRLLLASVGSAVLTAAAAFAADMPPSRSLPMPRAPTYVPFFSWNGFYIGGQAGYGFGQSKWTDSVTGASTGDFDIDGALAGGTLGYNVQLGGWVFGIEADAAWTNIKGSTTTNCPAGCTTSSDWLGTARARVGYAFDRFMPFVSGGASFGDVSGSNGAGGSFSDVKTGWTAGGGLEYAFLGNWSAKFEYLYVDLGKAGCDAACSAGSPFDVTFTSHIIRGGLNYRF